MTFRTPLLLMHDYTPSAKVYWWLTVSMGFVVIAMSAMQVAALDAAALLQVLAGAALAAITGLFPVRIPGRKTSVAGAEIFVFLLLLLYGPSAAALAAAGEAGVGSCRTSTRLTSRIGSPAMAALAMYGCGGAYTLTVDALGTIQVIGIGVVFAALFVAAIAYYATATLLMESLLSLKQGRPIRPLVLLWDDNWLALAYVASASIAGLVYMTRSMFGTTVLLIAVPIIAMFLSTLHLLFRKTEAEERVQRERVAAAEREVAEKARHVTALQEAEARLQHIAYHDGLTNLPNRSYFLAELARVVAVAARDVDMRFAVMFLDFDRFKMINDSLGHAAGDELLTTAARRLRGCLRPSDLVARIGGDEFAILVGHFRADREIVELAERVLRVLGEPMHIGGTDVATSASIGITTSALHYAAPDDVMREADIAMYAAKAQGKARYAIFDGRLHDKVSSRLRMENELRNAIDNDGLTVDFQPIFDLRTHRLYAFEALARWPHPERGSISPDEFIPLAEETGLIVELGDRILEISCNHLAQWQKTIPNAAEVRIHVNVSPVQLTKRDYPVRTIRIIEAAGLRFDQVTLEITENVLVDRLSTALPNLQQLRDRGVSISVDDFGRGYSSLSALDDLPIGEFKIDRSFVNRLAQGKGEALVSAILALGRSMGKEVIVEGIETEAQLDQVRRLGCERGQGFLLGKPLTADYAEVLVRQSMPIVRIAYSRPSAA